LVDTLESYGLKYFRGSLDNVLDRVVNALSSYSNKTIVFRLTADNIFPDGSLLDEIEIEFLEKKLDYFCCNGVPSGLPYGVSVEVTMLAHLREAANESKDAYDQEHVTPYIFRKYGQTYFQKYLGLNKGHYRCTVDCLDDYLIAQKVFSDVIDPIYEPFLALLPRLEMAPFQPITDAPVPKLVLGAAQFGSDYGIANTTGQPNARSCKGLIKTAISNGVNYLDTARVYGNSEAMIGQSLNDGWKGRVKIITKLSPLHDCPKEMSPSILNAFVDASIYQSCAFLGVDKLDVLMLHRAAHLYEWDGGVWQRLLDLQLSGVIGELGVSVQNPEELAKTLIVPQINFIQLPFNLLDWRWDNLISDILLMKEKRKLIIHVRSSLLQGLLTSNDETHWQKANVAQSLPVREWLLNQVLTCQRHDVVDLCLSYVSAMDWVDGVTIGMENIDQLIENINNFNLAPLSASHVRQIQTTRPKLGIETLNPGLWR
jgi:spore coat polysaccharide biosynthesis protein SpsF